ncbi:hypothetical protein [Microvirga lupini]|nr:hypothetical protein [Microvirga lupini]
MNAWKVIDEARITSLEQLKALAPVINDFPGIDPEIAKVIHDRLERLAAKRTIRVRLVFPKRPHRKPGRVKPQGKSRSPTQTSGQL